jgi:predicted nucleotidyltransferase
MNRDMILEALQSVKIQLEKLGYEVLGVFLQGSQNYGLEIYDEVYQSDIDCKAFVMPTFEDLYRGRQTSVTVTTPYGLVDVKDIRLVFELMKKANPSYVELLFTEYFVAEDVKFLEYAEELIRDRRPLLLKGIYGMTTEKLKALKHPFPSILEQIEKYGYDPKQLHHIVRLYYLAKGLDEGYTSYKELLKPKGEEREFLLDLKLGNYTLQEAEKIAEDYAKRTKEIVDKTPIEGYVKNNSLEKIDKVIMESVKDKFKKVL